MRKKLFEKKDYKRGAIYVAMVMFGYAVCAMTFTMLNFGTALKVNVDAIMPVGLVLSALVGFMSGLMDSE